MASNQTERGGHLDANGGRTVVFCHNCRHEWYEDEHGIASCPRCHRDVVEVVEAETDPRSMYLDDQPSPSLRRGPYDPLDVSDPDELDIDHHMHAGPGLHFHERSFGPNRTGRQSRSRTPLGHDHDDIHDHVHHGHDHGHMHGHGPGHGPGMTGDETFRRFSELLTGLGIGGMANGGGGGDNVVTHTVSTGPGIRRTTYTGNGTRMTQLTFTATLGGPSRNRAGPATFLGPGGPGAGAGPPDHDHGFPPAFRELFSGLQMPPNAPGGGDRDAEADRVPPPLAMLLGLLNPANARQGDAVFTQEALDRVITALMEANPQSNAAPPATDDGLSKLKRQKVDEKLLGSEGGNIECTICIEELQVGDDVAHLPCKHWFHDQCVVMWLKEHNTCPICRHPIEDQGNRANSSTRAANGRPPQPTSNPAGGSRGPPRGFPFFGGPFVQNQFPGGSPGSGATRSPFGSGASPDPSARDRDRLAAAGSADTLLEALRSSRLSRQASQDARSRDYPLASLRPQSDSQASMHESIQNLSRAGERRRNRPLSALPEQTSSSSASRLASLRPRRNSLSPSASPDPLRAAARARSPSSQSRRSVISDRDNGSRHHSNRPTTSDRDRDRDRDAPPRGARGWFRDLLPGSSRREERRRS